MKKLLKWFSILLAANLCALTVYSLTWVRQYQQLADEEPESVFSPNIADLMYCT